MVRNLETGNIPAQIRSDKRAVLGVAGLGVRELTVALIYSLSLR
jgi:hypothetical protein